MSSHPSYESIVEQAWEVSHPINVNLGRVRDNSVRLNKDTFGNIFYRKQEVEGRMKVVQHELERVDSASLLRTMVQIQHELDATLWQEELL